MKRTSKLIILFLVFFAGLTYSQTHKGINFDYWKQQEEITFPVFKKYFPGLNSTLQLLIWVKVQQ